MLQEVGQRTTKKLNIGGIKESLKAFVVKYFLQGKYVLLQYGNMGCQVSKQGVQN